MFRFKIFPVLLITLFITLASCTSTGEEEEALYTEVSVSKMETEVLDLVNEYRISQGLNALKFGRVAYDFATEHNTYMIAKGRISHDNFALRSSNLSVKVHANYVSENVGKDFTTPSGIVKAWINSPVHKKVMEGDFTYTAVSVKADAQGILYFTELFYK